MRVLPLIRARLTIAFLLTLHFSWNSVGVHHALGASCFTVPIAVDGDDDDDDDEDEIRFQTVSRLTLSFAEDGTPISRFESELFTAFSEILSREDIEYLVLHAFQRWARHSAINVGLVQEFGEDGLPVQPGVPGLPFGIGGFSQSDMRFGDIRIGAVPMAPDVFAVAVPNHDFVSGTWSGDLLFNSDATFENPQHFFAVALHEAGHVLGLGHTTDTTSVMHPTALNTILNANDITELQALYGDRIYLDENDEDDPDEEDNDTIDEAEEIRNEDEVGGEIPLLVFGDIEDANDIDFFEFDPNENALVEFRVVSTGVSLLQPRISVFSFDEDTEQLKLLDYEESTQLQGSDVAVVVPTDTSLLYYAKIEAIGGEHHDFGTYGLVATILDNVTQGEELIELALRRNYGELEQENLQQLFLTNLTAPIVDDLHTNDSFATATPLMAPLNIALHSSYREQASVSDLTDIDYYTLVAEAAVMSVRVSALDEFGLIPDLAVFDVSQNPVSGLVKVNGNGELLIEYPELTIGELYYVVVGADAPSGTFGTGNYDLNIAFATTERSLDELGRGVLDRQNRHREHTLYVARTQLFHFALSGTNSYLERNATIWMSVYDEAGDLRYRVATRPNETRTAKSVLLTPGSYSVAIDYTSPSSTMRQYYGFSMNASESRLPRLTYAIDGVGVSEPTGPELLDPADDPFAPCDKSGSDFCYPNNHFSPDPFVFIEDDELDVVPNSPRPTWVDSNDWYWVVDWLG